jgi:aromatic-L-amino-acid decarboxylase
MTPDEFRAFGHQLIDWIADYRTTVASRPVMARSSPGDIKAQLPPSPPEMPESFEHVFRDLERIIIPGLSHWQHPLFFGYFPSNASLASVLGDYFSTGLGVLGLSWQSSPAVTELEEVVTDWVRQAVGLSATWSGVIQDTASTSTLTALICARERASESCSNRGGLQAEQQPLMVYASDQAHSSVAKAALLAGFGRRNIRTVGHDDEYGMCPDSLAAAIQEDIASGKRPAAIVATTGTTTTTALDPVGDIARVAREYNSWLHVDAAMAGSAMIVPDCRWMWQGVECADSLVINAHKWLGAVFDCSLYFVRSPEHLVRVMSTDPSYLKSSADGTVKNLRDWGIPLGRRFRALKLWCLFRAEGLNGLKARISRDLENAKWLADVIRSTPDWRVLAPVRLQTICVRHEPPGLQGEELDRHTLGWVERVNQSGQGYLTPAILDGRWMVRISVGAEATERQHVESLWTRMQEEVKRALEPAVRPGVQAGLA